MSSGRIRIGVLACAIVLAAVQNTHAASGTIVALGASNT